MHVKTGKYFFLKLQKITSQTEGLINNNLVKVQEQMNPDDKHIKYAKLEGDTAVYLTYNCLVGLSLDTEGNKITEKAFDMNTQSHALLFLVIKYSETCDWSCLFS